jgi:signal transduction histidine kinase
VSKTKRPIQQSISLNLAMFLLAMILIVLAVTISTTVIIQDAQAKDIMITRLEDAALTLEKSLAIPLWNFDLSTAEVILEAELSTLVIEYIQLNLPNEIISLWKDAEETILRSDEALPTEVLQMAESYFNGVIEFNGVEIAQYSVGASSKRELESFSEFTTYQVLVGILGTALLFIPIYTMIRIKVVKRIQNLVSLVSKYREGNFEPRSTDLINDEIGFLAKTMNILASELDTYKTQMEILVEDRTTQLVEAEKLAGLGSLVAGLAHEIGSPLGVSVTSASSILQILFELQNSFEKGEILKSEFSESMTKSIKGLEIIGLNLSRVNHLLNSFKEVGVDQLSDQPRIINFKEYIQTILFTLKPSLEQANVEIDLQIEDNLVIKTHPSALYQIFSNIIMNALKHGLKDQNDGIVTISTKNQGSNYLISISDNGRGIPPEYLDQIFSPFFTTARNEGGTGLGLYIVFTLVKRLGGKISCKNNLPQGASFIISLNRESKE